MAAVGFFSAVVIVAVIFGFLVFLYYFLLGMWIRTIAAGVPLSIITLVRMRLMGIQPSVIVTNLVRARKAGLRRSTRCSRTIWPAAASRR
jgi:uncharacterized protein YqfA (UPF0365 family)